MEFLSLLSDRKRIMAKLMVDKLDTQSLDRLMTSEPENVVKKYEEWKKKAENSDYNIISPVASPSDSPPVRPIRREDFNSLIRPMASMNMASSSISPNSSPIQSSRFSMPEDATIMPKVPPEVFDKMPREMTVVFLGETGVGKSTFVNGIVNYLKYATIYEALQKGVEILIKTYFTQTDENYVPVEIRCDPTVASEKVGDVENEKASAGKSSTLSPKSYLFTWTYGTEEKTIRIIDTPGVGDVEGLAVEKENFQKILSFLADFKEINAICILLKPNEARLTLQIRYCINELLSHLHVSAAANILFCFTNTRQTLYRPGESLPTLNAHLDFIRKERNVKLPLEANTIFCFDNESFRFLCAMSRGSKFTDDEKVNFNGSWKKSVEETFRLFGRIAELEPHEVDKTLSINNIRSVILAMARPLAEVARNQLLNSQLIAEKIKEIQDRVNKKQDLNGRLYVEQVKIIPKEIDYPVTVCTAASCVEHMRFSANANSPMQTVFKTECHKRCYLEGLQVEQIPNPGLQRCWALYQDIEHCRTCKCPWTTHMHIKYLLDKVMEKVVDETIQVSIKKQEDIIQVAEAFIAKENQRKDELKREAEKISEYCGEFAAFLKKNSLLTYNDAYKDYVDHLINEEKAKGQLNNPVLAQLEAFKGDYEQQIKLLNTPISKVKGDKTVEEIYKMVDQLKNLKNSGKLLVEVQKLEMLCVRKQKMTQSIMVNLNGGWLDNVAKRNTPTRVKNYLNKMGRYLPS